MARIGRSYQQRSGVARWENWQQAEFYRLYPFRCSPSRCGETPEVAEGRLAQLIEEARATGQTVIPLN